MHFDIACHYTSRADGKQQGQDTRTDTSRADGQRTGEDSRAEVWMKSAELMQCQCKRDKRLNLAPVLEVPLPEAEVAVSEGFACVPQAQRRTISKLRMPTL